MIQHFPLGAFTKAKSWLACSLFKAPGSLLLRWKNTVWCLFLLHSSCVTPSTGRSEVRHRNTVAPHLRTHCLAHGHFSRCSVCFLAENRSLIGCQGQIFMSELLQCWQLLESEFGEFFPSSQPLSHVQHLPAHIPTCRMQRSEERMQHWWSIKWAGTLQHWCLLHTHTNSLGLLSLADLQSAAVWLLQRTALHHSDSQLLEFSETPPPSPQRTMLMFVHVPIQYLHRAWVYV